MMYPLVRELAADRIPVTVTCGVLGLCRQAYYRWLAAPVCARDIDDAYTINRMRAIHDDDPEFGYRFIADELELAGHRSGENRVQRLCAQERIYSVITAKGRKHARPGPPSHDDLVQRDFDVDELDRVWFTDISEHPTAEGKLYICAIKDACSNRIVGYATGPRMTSRLAVAALQLAIVRRNPTGTVVVHSDRGSQFRSRAFIATLKSAELTGSMGRVGAAGDNAAMESFFNLLQTNVLDRQRWATRDDLAAAVITWIEKTYNRRRRQRALGKLTPLEFETVLHPVAAAA
jgi:putative transposase